MIICITGPTGIGKTKLSIMLAKKYSAIVINADATSIYKELNIGSAKVTKEEMDSIPHYMIDIKNPNEDYSVSDFQKDARKILDNNKDKNIIVVGGTGLYINALFNNYEFAPQKEKKYLDLSNEVLYKMAIEKDPNMDIHPNNRVRLINFLNNDNPSNNKNEALYDVIYIGLTASRDEIYKLADKRVDNMMETGLLKEVQDLYREYPNSLILKRAIGYKELVDYLNNDITLDEAIDLIKKNTRHFIKRQYTWYNHQMNLNWFDVNINNFNKTYDAVVAFIESLNSK